MFPLSQQGHPSLIALFPQAVANTDTPGRHQELHPENQMQGEVILNGGKDINRSLSLEKAISSSIFRRIQCGFF